MKILKLTVIFLILALVSCQSIPIERTSHCACDWKPINNQTDRVLV
jgi:hypothetical protein